MKPVEQVSRLWVALRLLFPAMLDDWQGCVKMHPVSESLSGYSLPNFDYWQGCMKQLVRSHSQLQAIPCQVGWLTRLHEMHPGSESLSGYSWPSWMTEKAVWKCIQRVSYSQAIPAKLDDQQGCVKAHSPYELLSAAGYSLPSQVADKDVWKCIQEVRGLACYYTWTGDIQVYAGQNSFGTLSSCIQEYPYYNLFLIDAFPPAHPE